jgi:N-acetylglucosaminyldiphosphoundecaprenol N-acetyl-beta-D-mannosaminyltransferase
MSPAELSFSASSPWSADVLGVRVDSVAVPDLIQAVEGAFALQSRLLVVNANVHLVNLAQHRPWLKALFQRADIAFCDSKGVQLAVQALTGRKPHRHTPPDWIDELARRLGRDHRTVYWLGGKPETVARAAARLEQDTGLRAVGYHHGYFDHEAGSADNEAVIAEINAARPDLLLLVMGMPLQEQWLDRYWDRVHARVAITGGALVDHVAELVARPRSWVSDYGLEWLVRLAVEPRRLWRRYLLGLPSFGVRLAPRVLHVWLMRSVAVARPVAAEPTGRR